VNFIVIVYIIIHGVTICFN